jgi:hypothetical protein
MNYYADFGAGHFRIQKTPCLPTGRSETGRETRMFDSATGTASSSLAKVCRGAHENEDLQPSDESMQFGENAIQEIEDRTWND